MNSYHFKIYPLGTMRPQDRTIHFEGGVYMVFINGPC